MERTCWAEGVECLQQQAHEGFLKSDCKELPSRKELRERIKRKGKLCIKVYEAKPVLYWDAERSQLAFQKAQCKNRASLNFKAVHSFRRTLSFLNKLSNIDLDSKTQRVSVWQCNAWLHTFFRSLRHKCWLLATKFFWPMEFRCHKGKVQIF